jgi:hypothetical protein
MAENKTGDGLNPNIDRALRHGARCRILVALHAEGPLSPASFSKTKLGRGAQVNTYSYHFKELVKCGLAELVDRPSKGQEVSCRYTATGLLTQAVVDAAALLAISEVVESVPETLHQWIDGPYIHTVDALVTKAGRRCEQSLGPKSASA